MAENYYLDMLRRLRFKLESEEELIERTKNEFVYEVAKRYDL